MIYPTPNSTSTLKALLARSNRSKSLGATEPITLGAARLDNALDGGLFRAALHEVYAEQGANDAASATGFALGIALRAAGQRSLVWVRQDFVDDQAGGVYGSGLLAFGGDPNRMMIVRVPDQREAMRAAEEAVHCAALGAVLVEIWGKSHVVGLTATRRLGFAAARSGLPCILVRLAATPAPSAAMTRWSVSATPSRRLEANAPGPPAFALTLLRHRTGIPGSTLHVEWDRDCLIFTDLAPIPCPMVSLPVSRAIDTVESRLWLRVG